MSSRKKQHLRIYSSVKSETSLLVSQQHQQHQNHAQVGSPLRASTDAVRNPIRAKHLPKPIVKNGSAFMPNSENVGGRIMINQNKNRHAQSMRSITKQIDNSLPWSYRQPTTIFSLGSGMSMMNNSILSTGTTRGTKLRSSTAATTKKSSKKSKDASHEKSKSDPLIMPDPTLTLDHEQRTIYENFVDMLAELCIHESNRATFAGDVAEHASHIAKFAVQEAVERYLLQDYGDQNTNDDDNSHINNDAHHYEIRAPSNQSSHKFEFEEDDTQIADEPISAFVTDENNAQTREDELPTGDGTTTPSSYL